MCDYNTLLALYQYADSQNIDVYYYAMRQVKSIALPDETIVMNTDKIETGTEETVHLAHELGHIETGSFYSIHSEFDLRAKHELRADRRAIKRLILATDCKKPSAAAYAIYGSLPSTSR